MGIMQSSTGRRVVLDAHTTVGRDLSAQLRLCSRAASGVHAELRWSPQGWRVRDLNSANGTWCKGARLELAPQILLEGDTLMFGSQDETWRLVDSTPPSAVARCAGHTRRGNPLALPNEQEPVLIISSTCASLWSILDLRTGSRRFVTGDCAIALDGRTWLLQLPPLTHRTLSFDQPPPIAHHRLEFELFEDMPTALVVHQRSQRRRRPLRAHHRLLYQLACRRQNDQAELAEPRTLTHAAEVGWTEAHLLCRILQCDRRAFNVHVYRARKEFSELGVPDFANIVERRTTQTRGAYLYRLGTGNVGITQLCA